LLQPVADDGYGFGGVGCLVSSAVLDQEWRLTARIGVDLDSVELVLVPDEVDVVVIGRVSHLQPLDDQRWHVLTQLVEDII